MDLYDSTAKEPHMNLLDHINNVRISERLADAKCFILLETNNSTQAMLLATFVHQTHVHFPNCTFVTFGAKPKFSQGGLIRIPGIRTDASIKAAMVQYIRTAINPMPFAENPIKLGFKEGLNHQHCHYKNTPGQRESDNPNVFDTLIRQLSNYKKKVEFKPGGVVSVNYGGKPEDKDDGVQVVGMALLVAYTLVAMENPNSNYKSLSKTYEMLHPSRLDARNYNQV